MPAEISTDQTEHILSQVQQAVKNKSPLNIQGANSKYFYANPVQATVLDVSQHQGIINYQPSELVITARAGTRLTEIESALDEHNQMLAFEPPGYATDATLGGTIACNFSGPRRASAGAARDYTLGCTLINGKAEIIHFGGEVMKKLLDISVKVLPKPEAQSTLVLQCDITQALQKLHHWANTAMPISASCFDGENLYIRLSGSEPGVRSASKIIGGEHLAAADNFWHQLKEHQHPFFNDDERPIWRLSLASNSEVLALQGNTLIEWGGALRWLKSSDTAENIRHQVHAHGGHATLFRNNRKQVEPFHELSPGILNLHRQLKNAFDPLHIFNPGRMYAGL